MLAEILKSNQDSAMIIMTLVLFDDCELQILYFYYQKRILHNKTQPDISKKEKEREMRNGKLIKN